MNDLRTAAQQALEALEDLADCGTEAWSEQRPCVQIGREAITALRSALAQQDEPVEKPITRLFGTLPVHDTQQALAQDRHGACPTHCCPVHGCKYMHDDCPVVSGAVQPVYPRNNGCESCADDALAQQAEPLTIERLRYALVASRIIPPAAVEDPDRYDDGVTLFRIEALHRRIT